jgi:hypothetical protein
VAPVNTGPVNTGPLNTARPATPDDVHELCLALPEVELGISWGDRPTYKVPRGPRGRGFVLHRAPGRTAVNPATGEPYDDLLVIVTPSAEDKEALVGDGSTPFFTVPHFDGYNAVLVQQSRLGELTYDELAEVITDAWRSRAPARLRRRLRDEPG